MLLRLQLHHLLLSAPLWQVCIAKIFFFGLPLNEYRSQGLYLFTKKKTTMLQSLSLQNSYLVFRLCSWLSFPGCFWVPTKSLEPICSKYVLSKGFQFNLLFTFDGKICEVLDWTFIKREKFLCCNIMGWKILFVKSILSSAEILSELIITQSSSNPLIVWHIKWCLLFQLLLNHQKKYLCICFDDKGSFSYHRI